MKIEKIELNGFKSFSDRTVFNLHSGITCIVGPNGCGKSNIVDAFRWVLGEQSAKTLRGGKMEEVIFDGSSVKKPKGMADVTLHISGLNGASDGNGGGNNSITVSRRLYRSGDSEYMINKNICRLKDIRDLFLDTGLEVKSYSIIEQGHIDRILNTKPLDRRFLIEEVAGVMKYKVRKAEAQSKLESSRLNLQRINDVISEVKKQIKTLDRLVKKAERYKVISEELRDIELKINKKDYSELKETLLETDSNYEETNEKALSLRTTLSIKESDHEKEKLDTVHLEKELNTLNEEFQSLERTNAEIQKHIAVLRSEIDNARANATRLSNQITELDTKKKGLNEKSASLNEEKESLNTQFENFNLSVSEKKDFITELEQEIADIEVTIEEKRKDIFRTTESLSALNNDLTRLQSVVESMSKKEEGHNRELEEITSFMNSLEEKIADLDSSILNKNNDLSTIHEQRTKLVNNISDIKDNRDNLQKKISSIKEALASDNSRLESLREISSDGLTTDILNRSETLHVAGVISDVISVDTRYEKAIESILSDKINGIILSSFEDIESAVKHIKDKSLTRTALMTMESSPPEEISAPSHPSIIGRARDYLNTKESFSPIVGKLLNNVIIIQDLKSAHEVALHHKNLTFVTPDGDILDPTNTVLSGEGKGILKRKREIRDLTDTIQNKQKGLNETEQEFSRLKDVLVEQEKEVSSVEDKIVMIEKEISVHKNELQNLHDEKERIQKKKATINIEMEQTRQEKDTILKSVHDAEISR